VPYRTSFSPLAVKREWVTYQRLKWDAVIASPGPVLSEHDSAAEIWEDFQFTEALEGFHFKWMSGLNRLLRKLNFM